MSLFSKLSNPCLEKTVLINEYGLGEGVNTGTLMHYLQRAVPYGLDVALYCNEGDDDVR